jgi:hypothetical protein
VIVAHAILVTVQAVNAANAVKLVRLAEPLSVIAKTATVVLIVQGISIRKRNNFY